MCGLFGFVGESEIDRGELRRCICAARRRGPDSIGAWIVGADLRGELVRGLGSDFDAVLEDILDHAQERSARLVLGQCRLSPDSSWRQLRNAPPLLFSFGALAHNGNIPGCRDLAAARGLRFRTEVDTELVGRLVEDGMAEDPRHAFELVDSGAPAAWLVLFHDRLQAYRRIHPLNIVTRNGSHYLASDPRCGDPLPEETWQEYRIAPA